MPCGKGLLLLSQLVVGEKLGQSVVRQRLLTNLLEYAATYKLEHRPVVVCTKDIDANLVRSLDGIQLQYTTVADALAALDSARPKRPSCPPRRAT